MCLNKCMAALSLWLITNLNIAPGVMLVLSARRVASCYANATGLPSPKRKKTICEILIPVVFAEIAC
jgi:hypothetical protein